MAPTSRARTEPARTTPLWLHGHGQPGWRILPLRAFLGLTFTYAGLQKLANPAFLDSHDPTSVAHQMALLRHSSPIGPLVGLSTHAPVLVGLMIAFGELVVGLGTLLGLWARLAAVGGALLAFTFFLTVSWNTTPYYYGADIVFVFAWTVMIAFGAGDVLSVDAWLKDRARRDLGMGPQPATLTIAAPRLRKLCSRGTKCGLGADGYCTRLAGCPVFPLEDPMRADVSERLHRRTVVLGSAAAAVAGLVAVAAAGVTAMLGRAVGGTTRAAQVPAPTNAGGTSSATTSAGGGQGTAVGAASSLAVGQARSFTNPADGNPAWVVHPAAGTFVAFSAVCTHAGCPVQFDSSTTQFICPCHGGTYDARTGQVLGGPPPAPLPSIPVHVVNGQLRVD